MTIISSLIKEWRQILMSPNKYLVESFYHIINFFFSLKTALVQQLFLPCLRCYINNVGSISIAIVSFVIPSCNVINIYSRPNPNTNKNINSIQSCQAAIAINIRKILKSLSFYLAIFCASIVKDSNIKVATSLFIYSFSSYHHILIITPSLSKIQLS